MPAAMLLTRPSRTRRRKSASSGDGDVVAHDARVALALEPGGRGAGDRLLALGPATRRTPGSVRSRRRTSSCTPSQPASLSRRSRMTCTRPALLDDLGGAGGVLLGEREEQRLLVAEVVEDRAARQAGLGLEHLDGRALVAVPGERPPGAVEDLDRGGR